MRCFTPGSILRLTAITLCLVSLSDSAGAQDSAAAQETAAAQESAKPVALIGGTIVPANAEPIENGTLVFVDGKITAIGTDVAIPDDSERIDVSGRFVYPGMIESHSQIGLTEIGQVPATIDMAEAGQMNPNVRALIAVNPDSELIPVTRAAGVLLAVTAPTGGLVAGQSAVLQLDGWTYEDMCLRDGVAMQIQWPSGERRNFGRRRSVDRDDTDPDYQRQIGQLRDLFEEVASYRAGREARGDEQPADLRLESMIPVLTGEMPMMVRADTLRQIEDAVAFAAGHKARLIILGGYDAPLCAELLKKHSVPVIVSAVHRAPLRRSDEYDAAYSLPRRLHELGIEFCISCTDRSETWNTRNLPHEAAMAAAYGLSRDEALRSVTLYPARILGVADRVGSLEVGKDATLFVAAGDALEITTSVTEAWVRGRRIDLSSRHTRLYDKYRRKYEERETTPGEPSPR